MTKYLKILKIILRNAYIRDSKIFGYVFANLLFQFAEIAITIIFFNVIFSNVSTLGGWSFYQVLFLYIFAKFIFSLHKAIFRGGLTEISGQMIRRGDYDFYLTKPVNSLILASMSKPRIYEFVAMVFEVGIAIWTIVAGHLPIGFVNLIWFFVLAILSSIIFYSISVITVAPVFWLVKIWAIKDIVPRLQAFMRYPIGIFPFYLQVILMGVFPVMVASYIPVKTLFYPPEIRYILYMFVVTIIFTFIAKKVWQAGEKSYGSASS